MGNVIFYQAKMAENSWFKFAICEYVYILSVLC